MGVISQTFCRIRGKNGQAFCWIGWDLCWSDSLWDGVGLVKLSMKLCGINK